MNCNDCIHKDVCFDFWLSDCVSNESEENIDVMSLSWYENCKHFLMNDK